MLTFESFSIYIMLCVLAPLLGAFTLLFLFFFEKRIDLLEKQKREIALERELQIALYNQLNQEIQPHFLFNTLNSILSLARLDRKDELVRSIETLSKLLKFKYQSNNNYITIKDELTYIRYYMEIQKTRFRDRLHYEITTEIDVEHAIIIPFLIQTLVENAFKHAFEKSMGEYFLKVNVKKIGQEVNVTVWNNVLSDQIQIPKNNGIGLENIKKRLELLFPGEKTAVKLTNSEQGTTVLAVFPFEMKE
ncbi:histidine kinase [Bacillus sp. DTU_2020_1000418_1_SI_GHA_SEK_038]|uniref:sensor histidine kinase n=1 Tax=Bacillus sp. DTU_2020_1000418_1_SI_GHA_SEK_038 TaxID=3077585 RepID=UPI0028E50895|nr:histidine kinase [Bacillus sp. DTU_2020_1000418_1_SI_GHA_SEK_038]WNS76238.1 histidine kinase [Bacillus sp. DTU_2020_1000418_1_SI_GHA_SEK_038]